MTKRKIQGFLNGVRVNLGKLPSLLLREGEQDTTEVKKPTADGTQKGLELSNKTNPRMVGIKADEKPNK